MFAAFIAPKEDIFYQEETSADWDILNSIMRIIPIQDMNKYKTEHERFVDFFRASSVAMFKKWAEKEKMDLKIILF